MNIKLKVLGLASILGLGTVAQGQLLITQYYEGSSFNKYIELTNTGSGVIDFSTSSYTLSLWSNANTEAYKSAAGTPSSMLAIDSGSLAAGSSLVLAHSSASDPSYVSPDIINGSVINFNGDDSLVLSLGSVYAFADIVDVIGFTDSGSEGANTSIVRTSSEPGYSYDAGSTFEDFSSVWSDIGTAAADSASAGTDNYIGYSSITSPVPEPEIFGALAGALALGLAVVRRRRS